MGSTEHDELVAIRTQLTVAMLAVTQLQRKHPNSADAERLLDYVAAALARIAREMHTVDALMVRLEDRDAMRTDPVRLCMRRHDPNQSGRSEHGESTPARTEASNRSPENC